MSAKIFINGDFLRTPTGKFKTVRIGSKLYNKLIAEGFIFNPNLNVLIKFERVVIPTVLPIVEPRPIELPELTLDELLQFFNLYENEFVHSENIKDLAYYGAISTHDIVRSLKQQLPRSYPYYAQTVAAIIINKYDKRSRMEKRAVLIVNDKQRTDYINSLIDRILQYDLLNQHPNAVIANVYVKIIRDNGKQKVISVAKYTAGNCYLNIIQNAGKNVDSVYKKFPHLKPNTTDPVFINPEEISIVSKMLRLQTVVYTKLGSKTGKSWQTFGHPNDKKIHVTFSDGHATVMPGKIKVNNIEYHDYIDIPNTPDVVDSDYIQTEAGIIPTYYTTMTNGIFTLHKAFKPSLVTGNPDDDQNLDYRYSFTKDQVLGKIFKKENKIEQIPDLNIKNICKQTEHFIGRELFTPITSKTKEIDQIKCFMAYKQLQYYIGFPDNKLIPIKSQTLLENSVKTACRNITGYSTAFKKYYQYAGGEITLITPVVRYLIDIGATIDIDYQLIGNTNDIDIIAFGNKVLADGKINELELKLFRNRLVGSLIAGGVADTKPLIVRTSTQEELDQIIHECAIDNLAFSINDNVITVDIKNSGTGLFHFHSYILGYASINVMLMWDQIEQLGATVTGYNVDALLYTGSDAVMDEIFNLQSDVIGGWKISDPKPYYQYFKIGEKPAIEYTNIKLDLSERIMPTKNTVYNGPGGIGKSHIWKTQPAYNQIMTAPTRELREEHKIEFVNTFTYQKIFQPSISDEKFELLRAANKIPSKAMYYVIDEFGMASKNTWDTILSRAQGSIIIALGDFEQICNEIDSERVTTDYFVKHDFDINEIARTPDKICRHNYTEGVLLDSLRGLNISNQVELAKTFLQAVEPDIAQMIPTEPELNCDIIVTDSHLKCHKWNQEAREYCKNNNVLFPFKDRNGKTVRLPVDTKNVYWDRKSMTDVAPKGTKYEPKFAMTPDSVQGKTIDEIVYADISMKRHGSFYTAVTRTRGIDSVLLF